VANPIAANGASEAPSIIGNQKGHHVPVYEYKILHGTADKVEPKLNDLAAAGWEFVGFSSGSGGLMGAAFDFFGTAVVIVVRRAKAS